MTKETMIDIETLSLRPNAAIVAIGAYKFDNDGLGEHYYANIRFSEANLPGFHIDGQTVGFWFKNKQAARDALNPLGGITLIEALNGLGNFLKSETGGVWGCGSDFDNVILASAYRLTGMPLPWHYRRNRCYRTIMTLFPDLKYERIGELHNALDDAKTQASHAIKLLRHIGVFSKQLNLLSDEGDIRVEQI